MFDERNEQTNIVEISIEDIENLIKELQEIIGTEPKE